MNYFDQDPELYLECPDLLFSLYDCKVKSDIKNLFRDSLSEGFHNTEIQKLDVFFRKIIGDIP